MMMLTVDSSITGGNRERDKRTGFAIPFRLNLAGIAQFMAKPGWALNYFTHERFRLPQLDGHVDMGGGVMSISRYFTEMLDPSMTWDDVAEMVAHWGGQFCLKGVMSVEDSASGRRHRLHRHRAVEPRWPPARWLAQLRPSWPRSSTRWATAST